MFPLLLGVLSPILQQVVNKFFPDPTKQQEFMLAFMTQLQSADLGQLEINKAEAASDGNFKGGWRPAIGWVCAGALFYQYIFIPLGGYLSSFVGERYVTAILNAPKLDNMLWELLFGMLGMGALRSFDKFKGLTK